MMEHPTVKPAAMAQPIRSCSGTFQMWLARKGSVHQRQFVCRGFVVVAGRATNILDEQDEHVASNISFSNVFLQVYFSQAHCRP